MNWNPIFVLIPIILSQTYGARLHKLFQYLDGFKADFNLRGWLHLGYDYAVFLQIPKPHDKYLTYELYEAKKMDEQDDSKPRILAISKVPVEYIKDQLRLYREELNSAKHDDTIVPGTQVRTLREWQIEEALNYNSDGAGIADKMRVLRTKA